jgi:hypothetical protein
MLPQTLVNVIHQYCIIFRLSEFMEKPTGPSHLEPVSMKEFAGNYSLFAQSCYAVLCLRLPISAGNAIVHTVVGITW